MTTAQSRRRFPWPRVLALAALGSLIAIRWERFSDTLASMALTVGVVFTGSLETPGLWRWEHTQFWLATITLIILLWLLARPIFFPRRSSGSGAASMRSIRLAFISAADTRAALVLCVMGSVGLLAPLLAPNNPLEQGDLSSNRLRPPASSGWYQRGDADIGVETADMVAQLQRVNLRLARFEATGDPEHAGRTEHLFLLGSDAVGRDVLSRAIIGTRTSLAIGIFAAFGALLLGTVTGLGASLGTTVVNRAVTWTTDVFLSIPSIFLVVALAFFVGGSLWGLIAVLVLSGWMRTARIVRGEMLHLREQEFIQAARLLGVSRIRLVQRHFLPNLVPVLATSTVLLISEMLLAEAALGFLGFGVQPPLPSWGNMLGEAITHLERSWWIAAAPGTCLTIFVLALHHTAERIEAGTRF